MRRLLGPATGLLAAAGIVACGMESDPISPRTSAGSLSTTPAAGPTIFAISASDRLVSFQAADPCTVSSALAITGLEANETVLGIDFRPATGTLYALGSSSRIYTLDTNTGVATAVGAGPFTPALQGESFGFDFNPTVDRIRVVSNTGQNLRLNPVTGTVAATDTALAFRSTDPNAGSTPTVIAAAYTNPDNDPATGTLLYDIDRKLGILATQNPPNGGALNTVGSLKVKFNDLAGFDIAPGGGAYVVLKATGNAQPKQTCGNSDLYSVNLQSGAATRIGSVGTANPIKGIAIPAP